MLGGEDETKIPAPSSPLTIKINLTILKWVFDWFMGKFLPAYEAVITSELRTPDSNKAAGGVDNSTHLHGLARDFKLKFKNGGQPVPEAQAKAVFEQFISPNWPGFSEWEGSSANEGWHVHVQLSRQITEYAAIIGTAAIGVIGFKIISSLGSKHG